MIDIRSLLDAQAALRDLNNKIEVLNSQNLDFHGRRIINAGDAQNQQDYVTQKQLLDVFNQLNNDIKGVQSEINLIKRRLQDAGI